ncbi:2-C-methyl-D-erythritol 2,4-cyclodiphosphate synthase [hydrothermal vent metagenome]|uniref:2-C-methyl-D-erythritol 2,4-cyclodiphosphate synthase n=1 Tax=hydrothermal vent metagenome TaxID=652676 RepID=A0A1W1BPX2_9ZZZZ
MNYWVIIPATGIGARMGYDIPKQYIKLNNGLTILDQTIKTVLSIKQINGIIITLNKNDTLFSNSIFFNHPKIKTVIGDSERYLSVFNGINLLNAQKDDFVLVHDSVRPCVQKEDIEKLISTLKNNPVGGLLVTPIVDTLKQHKNNLTKTIDRSNLYSAQTPQMYRYDILKKALNNAITKDIIVTDETQAIELLNLNPTLVIGSKNNIKITHTDDLALANFFLNMNMKIKTGLGQDSHRFEEKQTDKKLILAGVEFKDHIALKGNSDADVILHSITNAISSISGVNILGKKADELCQNGIKDSAVYLTEALKTLGDWQITNIAISIECQTPKITPKIITMKEKISQLIKIDTTDIGITATTGESLTNFGKGKGIQVFSIITVSQ